LNNFELKRFEFEKSLKKEKRKKKRKGPHLPFGPAGPRPTFLLPAAARVPASFSSFFCAANTPAPLVGAPFFLLPTPLPPLFQAGVTAMNTAAPARAPSPPLPFQHSN
jgi:hypothetical protein